jgi:hypothetical protein
VERQGPQLPGAASAEGSAGGRPAYWSF